VSDVNRYELSRDMKPEEWPPVLVDELDYELMKRTAFQAQEMAKEIAAENATLKARLAAVERDIVQWKKVYDLRGRALQRSCSNCGYIPLVIHADTARADGAGEG
jgi:peptidoglycan hydrolase CwlO-like protein